MINNNLHTITAYRLEFSYRKRKNPLLEEQAEAIKNNEKPQFTIRDLIQLFLEAYGDNALCENTGYTLKLEHGADGEILPSGARRYHIKPNAGKRGKAMTLYDMSGQHEKQELTGDWASTYAHHVFLYDDQGVYYGIFHRQGGSGCKTIFLHMANALLAEKGLRLDMQWEFPEATHEIRKKISPQSITLIKECTVLSRDPADNISPKRRRKTIPVKSLKLELRSGMFDSLFIPLQDLIEGKDNKESCLNRIKTDLGPDGAGYSSASLEVRIGKVHKQVPWDQFEDLINGYDITEEINSANGKFEQVLTDCADRFFNDLARRRRAANE